MNRQVTTIPEVHKGKSFSGKVLSTKMLKTVIVAVTQTTTHPVYKKPVRKTRHFAVHNEFADVTVGDTVNIVETKPISKTKHFMVVRNKSA